MAPLVSFTDRGRAFLSRVVSLILCLCDIVNKPTTAYKSHANVLTEPLNRTLANILSMYVSTNLRDKDAALTFLTFAYHSARQDNTECSPFYRLYGRVRVLLIRSLLAFPPDSTLKKFTSDTIQRAEDITQSARQRTLDSQDRQCASYSDTHRSVNSSVGDLVFLRSLQRHVGLSVKLFSRYARPYRILCWTTDVTYVVEPVLPPRKVAHRPETWFTSHS